MDNDLSEIVEEVQSESADFSEETNTDAALGDDSNVQPEGDTETEFNAEDFMENMELEEPNTDGLLDLVNALGLSRNGEALNFKDIDSLKQAIGQGNDYTQKTQELSERGKTLEAEHTERIQTLETEHGQKIEELNQTIEEYHDDRIEAGIMLDVMNGLKNEDPDVFNEIYSRFESRLNDHKRQVNNPAITGLQTQIADLQKQLGQKGEVELNTEVKNLESEWSNEIQGLQEKNAVKLHRLGIKTNWEAAKNAWQAANAAGNPMTPTQAFYAVHGADIQKASEAQAKAVKTKTLSSNRRGPKKVGEQTETKVSEYGSGNYIDDIYDIAAGL